MIVCEECNWTFETQDDWFEHVCPLEPFTSSEWDDLTSGRLVTDFRSLEEARDQ